MTAISNRRRVPPGRLLLLLMVAILGACGPKRAPLTQLTPEQLWIRGIEEYNDAEWNEAIRFFERFAMVGGADPRVHQARFYIAQANFNQERYVTAASEFSRLAGDLGRADLADDARFMSCRAYEELSPGPQLDQEYTRAAIDHCRTLGEYFPESEFADDAAAIIERMRNRLAAKVYQGGEWYFRRRAYDSALIYYEDVAEQYPGTLWAPRALKRQVEIYTALEYQEERQEALQRLLRDYPDSPEARELGGADGAVS